MAKVIQRVVVVVTRLVEMGTKPIVVKDRLVMVACRMVEMVFRVVIRLIYM